MHLSKIVVFVGLLLLAACSPAPELVTVAVKQEAMQESFSEVARTQLPRSYPITMPLNGRIDPIALTEGDVLLVWGSN